MEGLVPAHEYNGVECWRTGTLALSGPGPSTLALDLVHWPCTALGLGTLGPVRPSTLGPVRPSVPGYWVRYGLSVMGPVQVVHWVRNS